MGEVKILKYYWMALYIQMFLTLTFLYSQINH